MCKQISYFVNASDGDSKKYNPEDVPHWVDRVQPEWIVNQQIKLWGEYKDGWPNASVFGGSSLGFILVDTRKNHFGTQ